MTRTCRTSTQIADRLEREIPGARRATIADTAHVPSMERPREFDELVLGFLQTRERRRPAEVVERIWARDATLWTGHDEAKWLGWLDEPMRMRSRLGRPRSGSSRSSLRRASSTPSSCSGWAGRASRPR